MSEIKVPHGPETVCYCNGPFGFRPYLQCICGWDVVEKTWEEIGHAFDDHLEATK